MMRRALFSFAVFLLLASCSEKGQREVSGDLYFATGSYLAQLDLQSRDAQIVTNFGEATVDHLSTFTNGELLVTLTMLRRHSAVTRIMRVDPRTQRQTELFLGTAAWFFPDSKTLVYVDGNDLMSISGPWESRVRQLILKHNSSGMLSLLPISEDEFLLEYGVADGQVLLRHSLTSGQSELLPSLADQCGLGGAVWISRESRLFCRKKGSPASRDAYAMVSVDGRSVSDVRLPDAEQLAAVAYSSEQDFVILTSSDPGMLGGRRTHGVWAYDLRTGQSRNISDDQYLGEFVVWSE